MASLTPPPPTTAVGLAWEGEETPAGVRVVYPASVALVLLSLLALQPGLLADETRWLRSLGLAAAETTGRKLVRLLAVGGDGGGQRARSAPTTAPPRLRGLLRRATRLALGAELLRRGARALGWVEQWAERGPSVARRRTTAPRRRAVRLGIRLP